MTKINFRIFETKGLSIRNDLFHFLQKIYNLEKPGATRTITKSKKTFLNQNLLPSANFFSFTLFLPALIFSIIFSSCRKNFDTSASQDLELTSLVLLFSSNRDNAIRSGFTQAGVIPLSFSISDSTDLIKLGEALFFDKILSGNKNISCATCHHPAGNTGDGLPLSIGTGGSGTASLRTIGSGNYIARNAQHIYNTGHPQMGDLFWDGRVSMNSSGHFLTPEAGLNGVSPSLSSITAVLTSALDAQALFPIVDSDEMMGGAGNDISDAGSTAASWSAVMARLVGTSNGTVGGIAAYRTLFQNAYPAVTNFDNFNIGHAGRAIAAYERSLTFVNTRFDRFLRGESGALSDAEKNGAMAFLMRGRCLQCHNGPLMSDFKFHAVANPQLGPGKEAGGDDRGLAHQTGNSADNYKFRTAPLRNVELTSPYTHAGAFSSLEDVIRHYGNPSQSLLNYNSSLLRSDFQSQVDSDAGRISARINALDSILLPSMQFNENEIAVMAAFLRSLTDPAAINVSIPSSVPSGLPVAD